MVEELIEEVTENSVPFNKDIDIIDMFNYMDCVTKYNKDTRSHITKNDMYSRSKIAGSSTFKNSSTFKYETVFVIGCGGIGSWVGRLLGNIENVKNLFLIDPDSVEISNLARTPFKIFNIGEKKVECLAKEINETNIFCKIYTIPELFDEVSMTHIKNNILKIMSHTQLQNILIIDCRDDDYQDYHHLDILKESKIPMNFTIMRSAYDDTSVTLDLSPVGRSVWGGRGYSIQPSHILPSFMSALLILSVAFNYDLIKEKYSYMFKYPITFNCFDILPLLFYSARTLTAASLGDVLFKKVVERWQNGEFDTQG